MNTLFMFLVAAGGKTSRKADPEGQSTYLQPPMAPDVSTSLLYDSYHDGMVRPSFCDDTAAGSCGPYDDDGEPE